ncbi:hypothetical protein HCH15_10965 [Corynebacterium testudinoris]|uniref:Uncharacterized protein n=1 Tax=Corynebacterium testudinoris TaxID=136857 RepID=A0A0G3H834_9CORY|nr:hypothetical protein [Corynebacterium testudinoris]AKK09514.1 hypothetical protein CTEST_10460 [Corynebacterium testudinoris]MBX8996694.1 hypothetical protein [Corynebacterium testudinoris]
MNNELLPGIDRYAAAEAALLRHADDADWAYRASISMGYGEYRNGVEDLLDMFDRKQVTPVPHDVIENARKVLTNPDEWCDDEIAKANRVLDKVAALGEGATDEVGPST